MNKLFKLPFYMAVSAMMAASFTACDDDNNGNPGDGELSAKDQALKEANVDTVYVGVPNFLHYSFVKKALNAGKNVICEKP